MRRENYKWTIFIWSNWSGIKSDLTNKTFAQFQSWEVDIQYHVFFDIPICSVAFVYRNFTDARYDGQKKNRKPQHSFL